MLLMTLKKILQFVKVQSPLTTVIRHLKEITDLSVIEGLKCKVIIPKFPRIKV